MQQASVLVLQTHSGLLANCIVLPLISQIYLIHGFKLMGAVNLRCFICKLFHPSYVLQEWWIHYNFPLR